MPASAPEVADIFRAAGQAYRAAHAGHLSVHRLKVMAAIVNCRTGSAAMSKAATTAAIAGSPTTPTATGTVRSARALLRTWLAEHEADLLPVGYFHVVFTLPAEVADIAWQKKAIVYDLLFRAASKTMMTIAADPKHLGARIGMTAVLAYLSRYTHRVALSNRRQIGFDETGVTFRHKDYRRSGPERQQVMWLDTDEFIRRFLLHVLPRGLHCIRHFGLLASVTRKANIARARELLAVAPPPEPVAAVEPPDPRSTCPCCGGRMRIIEPFERWMEPRAPTRANAAPGSPS